jgi:hypothetical protein
MVCDNKKDLDAKKLYARTDESANERKKSGKKKKKKEEKNLTPQKKLID